MESTATDPRVIDSIAVTATDVVVAVESRYQRDERVLFRVTPPFSGRMRARLHVPSGEEEVVSRTGETTPDPDEAGTPAGRTDGKSTDDTPDESGSPAYVAATELLADSAPAYPRPSETEAELRAEPDVEDTVERHHDRHGRTLGHWRRTIPDHVVDRTAVQTARGELVADVIVLGDGPGDGADSRPGA